MKLSTKLAQLRLEKAKARQPKPALAQKRKISRKTSIALVIILLIAGVGTWAVLELFVWHKLPAALVGTWEVQAGPMQSGTFEFGADGALTIRSKEGTDMQAHAAVEGKTLLTTTRNPVTSRDETRKSTIQELTANSLIIELEKGDVLRMARMK